MAARRIGRTVRPYFEKARDAALLAVEVYNKPAIRFRSSGFIALMTIAWTALLHAVFVRNGTNPYYKHRNGRYQKVDGDYRHWELGETVSQYWEAEPHNPIRKNLEFFIPLRNKIEHRYLPELDAAIFGECQAMLLNFDDVLGREFGAKHQLRESLSFSLQLFPSGASFAEAVRANRSLEDVKRFVDEYRSTIAPEIQASGQFSFKAFLIQVANHQSGDALAVQFVNYEKLTDAEKTEVERVVALVKYKQVGVANAGLIKPTQVVTRVVQRLAEEGRDDIRFTLGTHAKCWRRYNARPTNGSTTPELTNPKYCVYDSVHKDYLYTPAWIDLITEKLGNDAERIALLSSLAAQA